MQDDELLPSGERVYYDDYGTRYVVDDERRTVRKVGPKPRAKASCWCPVAKDALLKATQVGDTNGA